MEQLLLTPEQAAKLLAISRAKLYQLIMSGELPSILVGRSRRISVRALNEYIDKLVAGV